MKNLRTALAAATLILIATVAPATTAAADPLPTTQANDFGWGAPPSVTTNGDFGWG